MDDEVSIPLLPGYELADMRSFRGWLYQSSVTRNAYESKLLLFIMAISYLHLFLTVSKSSQPGFRLCVLAMLLIIVLITTLLIFVAYLTINYFAVSPSIPGPVLARFTDSWRAYQQYNGQLRSQLLSLHTEHGPIVRYGICSISLSDPKAIDILYGARKGFVTADSYKVLVGINNGKEVPSLLRRSVASAFTVRGTEDYESFVDATIPDLLDSIKRYRGKEFDLPVLLMLYSMDSASRMAFSESLGCLRSGEDVDGSISMIRDRLRHWGHWSSLPWLERLVFRNAWSMKKSIGRTPAATVSQAARKLQFRMSEGKDEQRKDMLHKFIQARHDNPQHIDASGIVSLLMSTITGAGDTTAATMTAIVYFLLQSPQVLAKLRQELEEAGLSKDGTPPYLTTSNLPYVSAIIKESMRLFPVITWPLERSVPTGGVTIAGQFLPAGTSVGIFAPALHLDRSVFGQDASLFKPERWLDPDAEKVKKMEQASMGFSRRRRVCLGQHVAIMQMKKLVPVLVMCFDLALVDANAQLDADMSPTVAHLKPMWVTAKERE